MDINKKEKRTLEEVKIIFENQLKIPKTKQKKTFYFCPVGLVGVGKTTVTKPISERLNLLRLSSDELRKVLKENGYGYEPLKSIGLKLTEKFAFDGYSIAFDMDCGNPITKEFIEFLARENNAKIFWIYVTAPEEYIFKKFKNHSPSWLSDNPQSMIDNYFNQKEKRERENTEFDFFFSFDTSKGDLPQQIDNCVDEIKKSLNK